MQNYIAILQLAFPEIIRKDVDLVCNILPLDNHIVKLHDGNSHNINNLIHEQKFSTFLKGETLEIPYRIYFDEPEQTAKDALSLNQRIILNCIYLRHHNGFIREKHLKELLGQSENWIIPHTLQLLGEYVYEIIEILENHINESTIKHYKEFINENPEYWNITKSRVASYWNVYYRDKSSKFRHYLGRNIAKKIENEA